MKLDSGYSHSNIKSSPSFRALCIKNDLAKAGEWVPQSMELAKPFLEKLANPSKDEHVGKSIKYILPEKRLISIVKNGTTKAVRIIQSPFSMKKAVLVDANEKEQLLNKNTPDVDILIWGFHRPLAFVNRGLKIVVTEQMPITKNPVKNLFTELKRRFNPYVRVDLHTDFSYKNRTDLVAAVEKAVNKFNTIHQGKGKQIKK
jgi:hypothetical protein